MSGTTTPWRDRIIPWYFVMFFVVIALVNAVMVTLALRTHTGTVTAHPYEKGLAYNKIVAAAQQQQALGWKGRIDYRQGALHFSLQDRNQRPLIPEKATATLTRPTQSGMDFTAPLTGEATPVTFPAKGLWEVRVDALNAGVHYQQTRRIVVE